MCDWEMRGFSTMRMKIDLYFDPLMVETFCVLAIFGTWLGLRKVIMKGYC